MIVTDDSCGYSFHTCSPDRCRRPFPAAAIGQAAGRRLSRSGRLSPGLYGTGPALRLRRIYKPVDIRRRRPSLSVLAGICRAIEVRNLPLQLRGFLIDRLHVPDQRQIDDPRRSNVIHTRKVRLVIDRDGQSIANLECALTLKVAATAVVQQQLGRNPCNTPQARDRFQE